MSADAPSSPVAALFSRLRPHLWAQKAPILKAFLLSAASRLGDIAYLFLFRSLVNDLQLSGAGGARVGLWAGSILGVLAAGAILDLGTAVFQARAGEGLTRGLREALFDRYQKLSLSFFHGRPTGAVLSHIQEASSLQQAVVMLVQGGSQLVYALCLVATAFWFDTRLSLVLMLTIPAILLPTRAIAGANRKLIMEARRVYGEINALVLESALGARVVRVFGGEDFESKRFARASADYSRLTLRTSLNDQYAWLLKSFGSALLTGYILYRVGRQVAAGERLIGDLSAYMVALTSLYRPIEILVTQYSNAQRLSGLSEKVFQVLGSPVDVREDGRLELGPGFQELEFRDVAFSYGGKPVLKGVSFIAREGQTTALVGPSGCGKSSLINLLPRLYDPVSGSILIDRRDIREYTLASLRSRISLVTQEVFLFEGTIRENIAYGRPGCSEEELRRAAEAAHLEEFIESLPSRYDTRVGENGVRLSGGQRQRIAIARAFLKNAPILILDEPTSALDPHTEREVQSALKNLNHRFALVVAHRLALVQDADRILLLSEGVIAAAGTHRSLLAGNPAYRRLYELQDDASG